MAVPISHRALAIDPSTWCSSERVYLSHPLRAAWHQTQARSQVPVRWPCFGLGVPRYPRADSSRTPGASRPTRSCGCCAVAEPPCIPSTPRDRTLTLGDQCGRRIREMTTLSKSMYTATRNAPRGRRLRPGAEDVEQVGADVMVGRAPPARTWRARPGSGCRVLRACPVTAPRPASYTRWRRRWRWWSRRRAVAAVRALCARPSRPVPDVRRPLPPASGPAGRRPRR